MSNEEIWAEFDALNRRMAQLGNQVRELEARLEIAERLLPEDVKAA